MSAKKTCFLFGQLVLTALVALSASAQTRRACQDLNNARLANRAAIVSAEAIAAEPARCKVTGTIEQRIGFEVNLPAEWNHKLLVVGIGGNAGTITDTSIGWRRNYATATTDTGHKGNGGDTSWAFNNPQGELDFAERAFHLTTVTAKEIVKQFYGEAARKAYFTGCSGGGRQGMIAAQRYPEDFDGIIVGAPAYTLTGFHFAFIWNGQAMFPDANNLSQPIVSNAKLKLLEAKVLAKCDALDGLSDGLIDDPRQCKFDAAKDLPRCSGAEVAECFTLPQIVALTKIYGGPRNNHQGQLYPGFHPGVESGWNVWLGEGNAAIKPLGPNLSYAYGEGFLRYWIYDRPDYKLHQFNFEKDIADTQAAAKLVNAESVHLRDFQERGGKIIFYHGWADNAFPAEATILYFNRVQRAFGIKKTETFARLFLVPGMLHCGGGPGCHQADYLTALEAWVEQDKAPDVIVGKGTNPARTRPLCVYPKVAKYHGSGEVNEAASFTCR